MAIIIAGTGSYVPERVMTNADLEALVDTTDEWIKSRTGIEERRIAAEGEQTSDLASKAAERALESAGMKAEDIDLIVVATCTPDKVFPSTACIVQQKIGAVGAVCMDLSAACSGFVYGMDVLRRMLMVGEETTALLIGAETMSSVVDWSDRGTCVLFGDGAGAAVLKKVDGKGGVGAAILGSNGKLGNLLCVEEGGVPLPRKDGSVPKRQGAIRMEGPEVFKHAVMNMARTAKRLLETDGWGPEELKLVVPHQANQRIIAAIRSKLKFPKEKIFINVEKYGNTSAASIGIALDQAVREGRLEEGDKVMLIGFGSGFTWGGVLVEWRTS